jgi:hypothetical protein
MVRRMAEAPQSAAAAQESIEQQAAAAQQRRRHHTVAPQYNSASITGHVHDKMAKAANRTTTAVEAATREQDMMMMRQAAAATQKYPDWAKLYHELGLNQQLHDHDHLTANAANRAAAEEDAMELTRNQNVMTTQLHHDQAGQ